MNLQDLASRMPRRKLRGQVYPVITPRAFKQMFDRVFPNNSSISEKWMRDDVLASGAHFTRFLNQITLWDMHAIFECDQATPRLTVQWNGLSWHRAAHLLHAELAISEINPCLANARLRAMAAAALPHVNSPRTRGLRCWSFLEGLNFQCGGAPFNWPIAAANGPAIHNSLNPQSLNLGEVCNLSADQRQDLVAKISSGVVLVYQKQVSGSQTINGHYAIHVGGGYVVGTNSPVGYPATRVDIFDAQLLKLYDIVELHTPNW